MLFAYRLAVKLGTADVSGLVDSLTDDQWLAWQAVAIIDGWFNGWTHTGELLAQMHNQTNRLEIASSSAPAELAKLQDWKSGQDVVKQLTNFGSKKKRKRKKTLLTPKQVEQKLLARMRQHGHNRT